MDEEQKSLEEMSTREILALAFPLWFVNFLGPFRDEVGWPIPLLKWGTIGVALDFVFDYSGYSIKPVLILAPVCFVLVYYCFYFFDE